MDPVYIIYIALHFVPILMLFGLFYYGKKTPKIFKSSLYCFAILYGLLMYSVLAYDAYLDFKLSQFDLDKNGIFSELENTPEKDEIMNKVISDTGRNFAPFTLFIMSFIISLLYYFTFKIFSYVRKNT